MKLTQKLAFIDTLKLRLKVVGGPGELVNHPITQMAPSRDKICVRVIDTLKKL
jgi:hypothetical protein